MTQWEEIRLRGLHARIKLGIVLYEDEVKELRELENKAAIEFAKKHGLTIGELK